jgi:hypothetical protein
MSVLTTFKIEGDADELMAAKKERLDPIFADEAKANGNLVHIVVREDDGIRVINVWETLEGSEKTAETVSSKIGDDLPRPTQWHSNEILQHETA